MKCDVLIVGGGPAGSTVAALLAKQGFSIALLERERFPRYHIGESLIPQVLDVLEESGALPKVEAAGFLRKEGGIFRWGKNPEPWSFYFEEASNRYRHQYAYQVIRSSFDKILLDHAKDLGVQVFEKYLAKEMEVVSVEGTMSSTKVTAVSDRDEPHVFESRLLVDCSGQSAWLGKKLSLLKYDPTLKNVALFSYFRDAARMKGRDANGIFCEATAAGWLWNIPLHDGTNSVGLVTKAPIRGDREQIYESAIKNSVYVKDMLASATRSDELHAVSDYSYRCDQLVGPGYVIVGDAGNFIDPVWSTGVFLATTGAKMAVEAIVSALKNNDPEQLKTYEKNFFHIVDGYREFVHFFYGANAHPEEYFWQAYRMISGAVDERDAFIQLVSGRLGLKKG